MIEVRITDKGIRMQGHAGCRGKDGIDLVCAAISALTNNLINSLTELSEDKIKAHTEVGMAIIEWEQLSDEGKLLVDSWFLGVAYINREYGCIQFK